MSDRQDIEGQIATPQTSPEPEELVGGMRQSLEDVMKWQETGIPSRFALGSGDLRKLAIRVREQPVNFLIIVHQSLSTAKNGQNLCGVGLKASRALLEEDQDKAYFTTEMLDAIQKSKSALSMHKNTFKQVVDDIKTELTKAVGKRERSIFLARISRCLSKDVKICEMMIQKAQKELSEIEKSLNLLTGWWNDVENGANHLQLDNTSLGSQERDDFERIKEGFMKLEQYFANYLEKMSQLYDENIGNLNDSDQKYLTKVQDYPSLVVSRKGRLEPVDNLTPKDGN